MKYNVLWLYSSGFFRCLYLTCRLFFVLLSLATCHFERKKTFAHGSSWSSLNWVPVKLDYLSVAVDDIFSGEKNTRVQNHVGCFCLTCRHPIMTHWKTFPRSRCSSRTLIRSRFLIWIWSKVLIYRRTTKKLHKETQQCDLFWHKIKFLFQFLWVSSVGTSLHWIACFESTATAFPSSRNQLESIETEKLLERRRGFKYRHLATVYTQTKRNRQSDYTTGQLAAS